METQRWETINELCDVVRETSFAIHRYHKNGHLEKVYENALVHRLRKQGLSVQSQVPLAVRDEDGTLIGFGNIQPAVLPRSDGALVAYMRENGPRNRIRICESSDDGLTWGRVENSELPNPGSGLDGLRLASGKWLLVYNDTVQGRHRLAVSISTDEGRTWRHTRHLENDDSGSFHYPAVTQGSDGTIHCVYSYFVAGGKSMKHAAFNEAWVEAK